MEGVNIVCMAARATTDLGNGYRDIIKANASFDHTASVESQKDSDCSEGHKDNVCDDESIAVSDRVLVVWHRPAQDDLQRWNAHIGRRMVCEWKKLVWKNCFSDVCELSWLGKS